jgi:hypothetical protein
VVEEALKRGHQVTAFVRSPEKRQLFNAIDPSPFQERDLDPRAEEFIVEWAKDLLFDAPWALVIRLALPEECANVDRHLHHASPLQVNSRWGNIATHGVRPSQGSDRVPTVASETPEPSIAYRPHVSELIAKLRTDEQRGLSDEEAGRTRPHPL